MNNVKHTPGPFHINPEWPVVVMTPDNRRVAYCYAAHSDFTEEMAQAHARLLAAAPELLAALKECTAALEFFDTAVKGYRHADLVALIAKAECDPPEAR